MRYTAHWAVKVLLCKVHLCSVYLYKVHTFAQLSLSPRRWEKSDLAGSREKSVAEPQLWITIRGKTVRIGWAKPCLPVYRDSGIFLGKTIKNEGFGCLLWTRGLRYKIFIFSFLGGNFLFSPQKIFSRINFWSRFNQKVKFVKKGYFLVELKKNGRLLACTYDFLHSQWIPHVVPCVYHAF